MPGLLRPPKSARSRSCIRRSPAAFASRLRRCCDDIISMRSSTQAVSTEASLVYRMSIGQFLYNQEEIVEWFECSRRMRLETFVGCQKFG